MLRMESDDRQQAERALKAFGRSYGERKDALDAQVKALQDERDEAILAAFANGLTTREIASVLGEISHQRVAQIVQRR